MSATYQIIYEGKDITREISAEVTGLTYTDKTIGEADDLTIQVKDETHKWKNTWNPTKGDKITANIITAAGTLPCGTFTVDEVRFTGEKNGGHYCDINALGVGVKDGVRTKTSFAHEGKTLYQIVNKIAAKYNYTVQGKINNYSIVRVTQFHETDMEFLHRLAEEYGYVFTLRGNILVFTYLPELSRDTSGYAVNFKDLIGSYTIVDKVAGIYVRGQNRYHNPKTKKLYDALVEAGALSSADALRLQHPVDNEQQGLYVADGRIYKKNQDQVEVSAAIKGNIFIVAGNKATLVGDEWGIYAGNYFIGESKHSLTKSGSYVTSARYKRILPNKPTGNPTATEYGYSPEASISAEAKDINTNLQQLINAINSNMVTATLLNLNRYAVLEKDVKSIQQKDRNDVADSITEQYTDIYNDLNGYLILGVPVTAMNNRGTIDSINTLQSYIKTFI